jgi:hypothetical protein
MTRHFPTYFHILCTYFADYCVMSLAVRKVLALSSVPKEWRPTKPEMHILRDRRPSTAACPACWAMWTKELKYCIVRWGKKYFILGRLEQPRQPKQFFFQHDKPNEPTKEGPLSFALFECPFTSVLTGSRGHPSLVPLDQTVRVHRAQAYRCSFYSVSSTTAFSNDSAAENFHSGLFTFQGATSPIVSKDPETLSTYVLLLCPRNSRNDKIKKIKSQ